jgi:hypothetical protein
MKTVSSIVENYIKTKPFIECFILGIINLTSLSEISCQVVNLRSEARCCCNGTKRLTEELDFRLNHKINKVKKYRRDNRTLCAN